MGLVGMMFGFGARDIGMEAAMNSAQQQLDDINEAIEEQSKLVNKSKVKDFFKGVGSRVQQANVANMASNMRSLTGDTGNLTSSLEAMALSNAKAVKPMIQGMDLAAKQAKKMTSRVSSMSIAMEVGATEIGEVFRSIHNAGESASKALDAMGMSEKQWVKVTQTTGVAMEDYTGLLGDMVASWDASPKQAAKMMNNLVEIGKKAKIGTKAIQAAKGHYDALGVIFEKLPPSMARTADEIQNVMESTFKLAGAFREMGETEEASTALAQQTAQMFATQAVEMEKMFKLGGEASIEDSPIIKFMTQLGMSTMDAYKVVQTGSRDVVKGVSSINSAFQKMGGKESPAVQHALAGLTSAMGDSAAGLGFLVQNSDIGTKALARMNAMVVSGTNQLKKYGEASFVLDRTLQQQLDRSKEMMDQQIRDVSRKDVRKFVGQQKDAYKDLGKEIKEMGSGKTWGPLVKSLSLFKQMGVKGLMMGAADAVGGKKVSSGIAKTSAMMDLVVGSMQQLSSEMGPAMELLGQFGPLGMVAGGIAAWFMIDGEQRSQILKTFEPLFTWVKKQAKEIWEGLAEGDTLQKAMETIKGAIDTIVDWGSIGMKIIKGIDWNFVANNMILTLDKVLGKGLASRALLGDAPEMIKKRMAFDKRMAGIEGKRKASDMMGPSMGIEAWRKQQDKLAMKAETLRLQKADVSADPGKKSWLGIGADALGNTPIMLLQKAGWEAGKRLLGTMSKGVESGQSELDKATSDAMDSSLNYLPEGSPAEKGPMSVAAGDPLTTSGKNMMLMMSDGIIMEQPVLQQTLSDALEQSVIYGMESYENKVKELMGKSQVFEQIGKSLLSQMGAKLDLAPTTEVNRQVRNELVTLLSIPGIAGVTTAIVVEGAKQRKVLEAIQQNTFDIANSDVIKKGKTSGESYVLA